MVKRFVPEYKCSVLWAEGVRRAIAWIETDPARQIVDEQVNQRWDAIIAAYQHAFPGR